MRALRANQSWRLVGLRYRRNVIVLKVGPAFGPPQAALGEVAAAGLVVVLCICRFVALLGGVDRFLNRL